MSGLEAILGHSLDHLIAANWQDPAAALTLGLGLREQRRVLGPADAFALAGPDTAWLLLSGELDLVFVRDGRRRFLHRVGPGGLLDAVAAAPDHDAPLAVPVGQVEVVATRRSALLSARSDPRLRAPRDQAWTDWFAITARLAGVAAAEIDPANQEATDARYALLREALSAWAGTRAERERRLLTARRTRVERALGAAMRDLIDILPARDPAPGPAGDPLLGACAEVFVALGMSRDDVPVVRGAGGDGLETIERLCRAARVPFVPVRLAPSWWTADQGPLLVFDAESRRPLAALPSGSRRHVLFDPSSGRRRRLDKRLAGTIAPDAIAFHAPLPRSDRLDRTLSPARLARFAAWRGGRDVFDIALAIILGGVLSLVPPIITGWIMDPIIPTADIGQVLVVTLLLLGCGLSQVGGSAIRSIAMLRLEGAMDNRLQAAVWNRLLNLPATFFTTYNAGDLASRAASVNVMRQTLSNAAGTFLHGGATALFSFGIMLYYSWRFSLAIGLLSGLFGVVMWTVGAVVLRRNEVVLDLSGRLQGLMLQLLTGIAKLRTAGAEASAFVQWARLYRRGAETAFRQHRLNMRLVVLRAVFGYVVPLAVVVLFGWQSGTLLALFRTAANWSDLSPAALARAISPADFVSFNVATGQFLGAVFAFTRGWLRVAGVQPLYRRLRPILAAEEEPPEPFEHRLDGKGGIEIVDLRFRYPGAVGCALDGVSLRVDPGEFVAIVGPSGAGKSSLVRLLLGFETAEAGSIFVDGVDTRRVSPRELRRHMGVVLQDGRLLAGSIRDNIAAGRLLSDALIAEATRIAGLDALLAGMPMGLETILGEGATDLSGGERQRVMIARAVARCPPILILDEATSALDNATQSAVSQSLAALRCSRIVVAHRLSTIRNADRIYVLSDGRVAEQGDYDSLMARGGLFSRLVERQRI